ncbi:MAG: YdcF family protein [Polyangiaceae bacterium]|nr:YdcF family protein [Polyangiaceae bacterium]
MAHTVLIVLGCRLAPGAGVQGAILRRLERALAAYTFGSEAQFVVSGGAVWHGVTEAQAMGDWLRSKGVPKSAILMEAHSKNTFENAQRVAELLRQTHDQPTELALATCAWHMPRALRAFRRYGLHPVALPAVSAEPARFSNNFRVVRELIATGVDTLRGWAAP